MSKCAECGQRFYDEGNVCRPEVAPLPGDCPECARLRWERDDARLLVGGIDLLECGTCGLIYNCQANYRCPGCSSPHHKKPAARINPESIAALCHDQWCHWMHYLFSKCHTLEDGSSAIPPELEERWRRQMGTPYRLLAEDEKESDRKMSAQFLDMLDPLKEVE